MGRLRRLIPYWLRGRGEVCACCGGTHDPAVTVRCVACDRPYCVLCFVTVENESWCSECDEERSRR